jgi:hypothetical protein
MTGKKWPALAALTLLLALFLSACGSDTTVDPPGDLPDTRLNLEDCGKTAAATFTTAASTTTSPATVSANGARIDPPPGTHIFISSTFPYALALPDGWDVKEGQSQGNIKGDLFIVKKGDNSGAYVTVIAEDETSQETGQAFFDRKYKEATGVSKLVFEKQPERTVGGVTAYVLAFNTPAGQNFSYPVQSIQLLFVGQNRGWGVTFTASPNQAVQYCPLFARMLDSFTFTGK